LTFTTFPSWFLARGTGSCGAGIGGVAMISP
jgi:hypothetical protein